MTLPRGAAASVGRPASLPNHSHVVYRPRVSASLVAPSAPTPHEPRAGRPCVRPGCARRASTTLRFDYAARAVTLDPLAPDTEPGEYDLCFRHAARSTPPTGWTLRDRAPSREPATEPAPPVGPDRDQGVARLAAALSAVRRAVSEDAPDAAPDGTDRSVHAGSVPAPDRAATPELAPVPDRAATPELVPVPDRAATPDRDPVRSRLDGLLRPSSDPDVAGARVHPVPLRERTPAAEVRPVPQPLRLAPDPTTTVWCADLLSGPHGGG
jgi:hypothetical protein